MFTALTERLRAVRRGPARRARDSEDAPGRLLVPSPVFVLSTVRSGSTLLRVLLDSHSRIRAPHEMHLRCQRVTVASGADESELAGVGLSRRRLDHLLWDAIMYRELVRSGKRVYVDKTPGNATVWQELAEAWPAARFVFLLRSPAACLASLRRAHPTWSEKRIVGDFRYYADPLEQARAALTAPAIRYEDLTADPKAELEGLCAAIGVAFEPAMVHYGRFDHGPYQQFLGDASPTIRSGRVQQSDPVPPEQIPAELRPLAQAWGYLPTGTADTADATVASAGAAGARPTR